MAKKSKYGWTFHAENHAKKNNKTNYLHLPSTSITALSFFFFSGIPCFCALCANICDAETERYSSKKIIIFCVFAGHSQYKMTATATAATNIRWLHCIFHLTGDQWLFAIVYYCVSVQQQTLCNCVVCIVPVTLSFIHVPNRSQKYNFLVSSSNNAIGSLCAGQKLIVHHRNTEQLACFFFFFVLATFFIYYHPNGYIAISGRHEKKIWLKHNELIHSVHLQNYYVGWWLFRASLSRFPRILTFNSKYFASSFAMFWFRISIRTEYNMKFW